MSIPSESKVTLIGAAGRMGGALVRSLAARKVPGLVLHGAVDLSTVPGQGADIGALSGAGPVGVELGANLPQVASSTDIFIDFSFHSGIKERGELIARHRKAWVIGTTGLTDEEKKSVQAIAQQIPVILAPNMSLGINLLAELVRQAAATLHDKGYDIEILEWHHRKKLDSPSGTALQLGEAAAKGAGWSLPEVAVHGRKGLANNERPVRQIGFHAVRGGDLVGDHRVQFCAEGEMIEFAHRATTRDTFAIGALRAAAWLLRQPPGFYGMKDVLGLR